MGGVYGMAENNSMFKMEAVWANIKLSPLSHLIGRLRIGLNLIGKSGQPPKLISP